MIVSFATDNCEFTYIAATCLGSLGFEKNIKSQSPVYKNEEKSNENIMSKNNVVVILQIFYAN